MSAEGRRWVCTVCGYVHPEDSPPDICPVCRAPWHRFLPWVEGEAPPVLEERVKARMGGVKPPPRGAVETPAATPLDEPVKRWRCLSCNYVHEGAEPPATCPVCGADRSRFEEVVGAPVHAHPGLAGLIEAMHAHPVSSHFPNACLPLALLSWLGWLALGEATLERTALYLLLAGAAVAPATLLTGLSDARHRFGTITKGVFGEKMLWGIVLVVILAATIAWRLKTGFSRAPDAMVEKVMFTAALALGSALVARLGMLGGRIVFGH